MALVESLTTITSRCVGAPSLWFLVRKPRPISREMVVREANVGQLIFDRKIQFPSPMSLPVLRNYNLLRLRLPLPPRHRSFRTSCILRDEGLSRSVVEENQGVTTMDGLLKVVRTHSNPAYHTIMPLRTPILWSEALLNAERKTTGQPEEAEQTKPPQDPLVPRHMYDSYSELILPFGSSTQLMEEYINASGGIRMGKLMEHLDSLAGSISYKHMLGPSVQTLGRIQERGFYIVTASVDRLDMLTPLNPSRDLRLSGQVIYTGRSSMEVAVKMETVGMGQPEETVLLGRFSMVCRDANTHKARPVNPLIFSTPEERSLYAIGEHLKQRRQSTALRSLSRVPPSSAEAEALHSFYLRYGQHDEKEMTKTDHTQGEQVWMGNTRLEKCMLMFPQERNVHQKVFGGYLMRLAYELGFTNTSIFTRGPIRFLSLDGISFARPVPIGSILRLTSQILHTSTPSESQFPMLVHVRVKANVVDVKTGSEQTTNDFRFTWSREEGEGVPRKVVPKTYKEAMLWLEGKRALELGDEIRGLRQQYHNQ
ncbi:hypothetical protein D9615_008028 [Tricholomella constricta]|uniref:HotDog ACOT-type domain-containing protein n=1 Tax=Tricholomella constricta TaxID=117010 RepID=A0A8H5H256_9AGAR|nr:hypothetical protein D9615_008028 [Tricholomella constricta]